MARDTQAAEPGCDRDDRPCGEAARAGASSRGQRPCRHAPADAGRYPATDQAGAGRSAVSVAANQHRRFAAGANTEFDAAQRASAGKRVRCGDAAERRVDGAAEPAADGVAEPTRGGECATATGSPGRAAKRAGHRRRQTQTGSAGK